MKGYLKDVVEWLAQKLIIQAANRSVEMLEEMDGKGTTPKQLPAPRIPEIELH
jgi:hypothetical protein